MKKHKPHASALPLSLSRAVSEPGSGLLYVPFAVVILLNLVGLLAPSIYSWGFNIWGSFNPAYFICLAALCGVCSVPTVARAVSHTLEAFVTWIGTFSPVWRGVAIAAVSAAVGTLFILWRSHAPIYGDGFTVVADSVTPILAPPDSYHEVIKIVPVMLFRVGATLLTKQMHLDSSAAVAIVSSIGGVLGFWGLWRLACSLGKSVSQSVALMSAGLAGGCTILFFGHLELYTWAIATLLWLLAATIDFVNGRATALVVCLWLIISVAMQALFLPTLLLIALVLTALRRPSPKTEPILRFSLSTTALSWGVLLCSFACGLFFTLVQTEFTFVPIWPKPDNPYFAFSAAHLVDMVNLIFLVAPIALTTLILVLIGGKRSADLSLELGEKLLGACALSLFLVSFWLDPTLGALRDWDLLSFFGFPATIFGGVLLLKRFTGETMRSLVTALSLSLILVVLVPHVVERNEGEKALMRIDPMVWQDVHYQPSCQEAHATVPWAAMIQTFSSQSDLADKYLWRKISVSPTSAMAWFNLGEIELARKHFDSAASVLAQAYRLSPSSDVCLARYAEALQANRERDKLQELLPRLRAMQSNSLKALESAGVVFVNERRSSDALVPFRKAYGLRPWGYLQCMDLGRVFYIMNQYDSATAYFREATSLAEADRPGAFHALIMAQIKQGRLQEARVSLGEFRHQFSGDPSIGELQALLNRQK